MTEKLNRYFILSAIAFFQFLTSCNKFIFIPNGTVINGDQQYYLNGSIKLAINVWGDFNIYNQKLKRGVRVDKLYPQDKNILNDLEVKRRETRFLFSAVPTVEPYYHFIAFLRNAEPENMKVYKVKYDKDTLLYYYRILTIPKFEIAETLIPFRKKYVEFLYYNHTPNDCPDCDVNDMSLRNSRQLQKGGEFSEILKRYGDSTGTHSMSFNIPRSKILKNKTALLTVYKIDAEQNLKELENFKFLRPNAGHIELKLPAGDYLIRYSDLYHRVVWSENTTVK
ncbi:MAG: hypothetical protein JST19_12910 [Bacteroidetes bacterium]|nr:hypothetical protein [Bacteroidota bacterium]